MAKPKTYDEALEQLNTAKEKLSEVKDGLREFKKENKIRRNKPVEDEKIAAQLEKKEEIVDKAREKVDLAKEAAKELKPRKERVTKYIYPDDCITDKDKKKFRAKARRDAKKKDEGDEGKEEKKSPKKKVVKKSQTEED